MLSESDTRAKVPFLLVWLMLAASIAPLAAASSTETQFSDGTTSYTHTFSGAGTGSTAGVVMPIGAEVTAATFNLLGEAATTTWANASTNTNFGGPATTNGLMSVPWFTQGYRTDIDVDNAFGMFNNNSLGMYAFAQYQFDLSWYGGVRYDYTEFPNSDLRGPDDEDWAISPYISWYITEYLRLRFEYQHLERDISGSDDEEEIFFLQLTAAFGSHPPHPYWVNR